MVDGLKESKAVGSDGTQNEVWRFDGEGIRRKALQICNKVWRGEDWPESWREGIIIPIVKKGQGTGVRGYRGVTLMQTLYKVYATILVRRMEEEVEKLGLLSAIQTGFRRGMGTLDNVYVLNYMVNRQLGREKCRMVAMFIDLKGAFDAVNRDILWEALEQRGVRRGLRERVKEAYRETSSRVRVGREGGGGFLDGERCKAGVPDELAVV